MHGFDNGNAPNAFTHPAVQLLVGCMGSFQAFSSILDNNILHLLVFGGHGRAEPSLLLKKKTWEYRATPFC